LKDEVCDLISLGFQLEAQNQELIMQHELKMTSKDALCNRLVAEQKNGHRRKLEDMQRERVRQALNQAELERAMLEDETSANAEYGPFELQGEDLNVPIFWA